MGPILQPDGLFVKIKKHLASAGVTLYQLSMAKPKPMQPAYAPKTITVQLDEDLRVRVERFRVAESSDGGPGWLSFRQALSAIVKAGLAAKGVQ
jgi:hypothetical protein